ncbi:MAG TPA: exopolyphosphatase, partial [Acidimicrobiaceae bacterium]|nr:exopolyphosphatase [Acidimicrobiaceae bacterium]
RTLDERLAGEEIAELDVRLVRSDRPDAPTNEQASAQLRVIAKDADPDKVGRRFSGAVTELALASYPGFYLTSPPGDAAAYGVFWPTLIPSDDVEQVVVLPDGTRRAVPVSPPVTSPGPSAPMVIGLDQEEAAARRSAAGFGPTRNLPLGTLVGARSGDKGGNANVGLWVRTDAAFVWLSSWMDVERLRMLLPEAAVLEVERHLLPNLRAVNFVVHGLLGEGVASSTRPDPQAKSLGEYLRSRLVDVPESLLSTVEAPGRPRSEHEEG